MMTLHLLPKKRQTVRFSATQTTKVEDLARLSFRNTPVYIGVDDQRAERTTDGLQQGCCVVDSAHRFLLLFSFLKRNLKKKVMVFFSSCNSVKDYFFVRFTEPWVLIEQAHSCRMISAALFASH